MSNAQFTLGVYRFLAIICSLPSPRLYKDDLFYIFATSETLESWVNANDYTTWLKETCTKENEQSVSWDDMFC